MFQNEAIRDFSQIENRQWIPVALSQIKNELPYKVMPVIDGHEQTVGQTLQLFCPSDLSLKIADYALSSKEMADEAVLACDRARHTWGCWSVEKRCQIIEQAAQLIRLRRNELAALIVMEVGKDFREADADVCEAIDFCVYYAQEMRRLGQERETMKVPGESNHFVYRPRGLTVAISPWNFPLAILCGMTVAPLVCGNPVIMKPAEQSGAIAQKLYFILREAGVPSEALQFLPGQGEVVGAYLVSHPKVHVITFTGSKNVGLQINAEAAKVVEGQFHIKKVIAEMGGKNAVIIDDDADLDEAILGCLQSAFGFQGQKCSALSRIFVHESCYDRFKERFKSALQALQVGPAYDIASRIGPVIDKDSQQRLLATIERYRDKVVYKKELSPELMSRGYFVPPTIFESDDPQSELGQKEFFGPLVCLFKIKDFEEGIKRVNDVEYALTGGVFSRSPQHLQMARELLEVGNLYINRGITGALVCRQPFGGFKLSGCGAKAGGPDYLLQYLEPRTITENTMRRGFAPT